jgi:murein DD-endopeptidase MepM/ murein hydrolase activator NlpD
MTRNNKHLYILCGLVCSLAMSSCKTGPINLFKTSSPHELYLRKLSTAGLGSTAMGKAWADTSALVLNKAMNIKVPYQESGYFAAERVPAAAYRFQALRGQKITIQLTKVPDSLFMIYMDLWEIRDDNSTKLIASADTLNSTLSIDADHSRSYLLRLQPELLSSGSYNLQITAGPSLAFPVSTKAKARVGSFFGAGRDANTRRHEGIDIFDVFHTPVVASANGTVTRVGENNLGGRIVMMRPAGKDYSLYYAHLDRQIAQEGQQVRVGDTLGLMGNTGNARSTPPHLHFGIYTNTGAVDPFPFVNPAVASPLPVSAPTDNLNASLRSKKQTQLYQGPYSDSEQVARIDAATIIHADGATSSWYKATLPDGKAGFLRSAEVVSIKTPLRKILLAESQLSMYDQPQATAAVKKVLKTGSSVNLLGHFNNYILVRDATEDVGWISSR